MTTRSATVSPFTQVQDSIRSLQSRAEELLDRLRKEAGNLVSKDRRKAIDKLVSQAKALPTDLQKKAGKMLKTLETSAEKLLSDAQSEASKRITWLVSFLSLPSKHDVDLLAKRLSSLEKKVEEILSARQGKA